MSKDYCTMFPEGSWGDSCCKKHDEEYRAGSGVSRKRADRNLRQCVRDKGKPVLAAIMYRGVRMFGWMFYRK